MIEGLYKVEFKTLGGAGAGVVLLKDRRVFGGDTLMAYQGSYDLQQDDDFKAQVHVTTHTRFPGMGSVFGMDTVNLHLSGRIGKDGGVMRGTTVEGEAMPGFTAKLTLLARA